MRTREILWPICEDKRSTVTEMWGQEKFCDRFVRTREVLWPKYEDTRSAVTKLWGQETCCDRTASTRGVLRSNVRTREVLWPATVRLCRVLIIRCIVALNLMNPHSISVLLFIFWPEIVWNLFSIMTALATTKKWRIIMFRFYVSIRWYLLQREIAWAFSVECKLILFKICIGNCRNAGL